MTEAKTDSRTIQSSESFFEEEREFTWRSAIIGSLLGCVVAASNLYLGLKIGWTFGASLFGAIFTFAIVKSMSQVLPTAFGGGYFGPKENCTAQTAASTAGGFNVGFITCIPALYRLGLMSDNVIDDVGALLMWATCAAFYGMFFAIPLRTYFVLKQDLPFPSPRATAESIKALHETITGEKDAMKKAKVMAAGFLLSFVVVLLAYWLYFLDKIHIIFWIGSAVGSTRMMNADRIWRWQLEPNFAFFGAGLMTPPHTLVSFLLGAVIAYGIAGPLMVESGYLVAAYGFGKAGNGSAQAWFIWPGISLMLFTSLTELAVHWRSFKNALMDGCEVLRSRLIQLRHHLGRSNSSIDCNKPMQETNDKLHENLDPVPAEKQIPALWWISGLIFSIILTCCVMNFWFHIPVYQSLLAVILAFPLSIIGVQCAGETDINPVSTLAKVVQLAFCRMPAPTLQDLQRSNLLSACVTSSAANQSVDMVQDLKAGHIIGASPRSQFLSQLVGSFFAVGVSVSLFVLYAKAYPCIIQPMEQCQFGMSAALGWENLTKILTTGSPIPIGSIICTIVCGVLSIITVIFRHKFVPEKYWWMIPNFNAVGIAFITPQPAIPTAMCLSLLISMIWKRVDFASYEHYRTVLAAGWIAGVGIAGICKAAFQIGGIPEHVVTWNCPYDEKGVYIC
ncbi:hypothetical protein K7432_002091 [Basidiobolus ranarum]|uniref:Oligopeptide transporter n=1 Tax=Basidiobolus ranarum TaxID=34480 RepID=A0ABR2X209_9FUNG